MGAIYMTQWKVPPDTSQKEKIVGGVLTAVQLMWMILGLGIAAGLGLFFANIMGIPGLVFGIIIGVGVGCFFCFYKKQGIPIFTYIRLNIKHNRKVKHLIHKQSISNKTNYIGGGF